MKFILHCDNPENLVLMARAAKHCAGLDVEDGYWGLLEYTHMDGTVNPISYIKRKSCFTLYEQPERTPHNDR